MFFYMEIHANQLEEEPSPRGNSLESLYNQLTGA